MTMIAVENDAVKASTHCYRNLHVADDDIIRC